MADNHVPEKDKLTGVETTGHEWDGLKELNNPAPRWWLLVLYATIIWAVGYWIVYPAWPTLSGNTAGQWGWTSYKELEASQSEIEARRAAYLGRFNAASFDEIAKDPELYAFATAGGKAAFKDNCATCHGSGGAGGPGYPNLNDDDWIWGGTLADIYQTIRFGIRSAHPDTRISQMPSFGKDGVLTSDQVYKVVDYVRSLSNLGAADAAGEGATIFAENCAACHGPEGKGGREFGAPNLTDAIWLYGSDREKVYQTVFYARAGVMPTWENRLNPSTIRQLAIYVHGLGGGEQEAAPVVEEAAPVEEETAPAQP
jgi:cytochrome c oxidase cbb3-type subunit 3